MQPVMSITKIAKQVARELAVRGMLLGVGVPGACLVALVICGLFLHSLMGFAPWDPALEFSSALAAAMASPYSIWIALLLVLLLVSAVVGSFDGWRSWQSSSGKFDNLDQRLMTVARRLRRFSFSLLIPVRYLSLIWAGRALPLHPPERTLTSTPAGLSGASPLLE